MELLQFLLPQKINGEPKKKDKVIIRTEEDEENFDTF